MESNNVQNVSNGAFAPELKTNMNGKEMKKAEDEDNNHIKVYLRIKAASNCDDVYKINSNLLTCEVPVSKYSHCMKNIKDGDYVKKTFKFSSIFNTETTQTEIFNRIVERKIRAFIDGMNCTLLTYGASGSGKTFTFMGTAEEPGIIPRSLEYLFRTLENIMSKDLLMKPLPNGEYIILNDEEVKKEQIMKENILKALTDSAQHISTYKDMQESLNKEQQATPVGKDDLIVCIWVSFAEINNEFIYDLLQADPQNGQRPKLSLVCNKNQQPYIKNLTTVNVTSATEAYQILQYGIQNLNHAHANKANSHSSRSHSIFTVKLVHLSKPDGQIHFCSSFNFCDLATSPKREASKKTQNGDESLNESSINSSLLVLSRCMNAVRNSHKENYDKVVPFNESKLTQLFQEALSGSECIAMIVNINPVRKAFKETQHVLNFSAIASDITILRQFIEIKPKKIDRFSLWFLQNCAGDESPEESSTVLTLEDLKDTVFHLKEQLEFQKIELEIENKSNRDYVTTGYKILIEENDAAWEEKLRKVEENLKNKGEKIIKKLQDDLKREKARPTAPSLDISSDDGGTIKLLKKQVKDLQRNLKIQKHVANDLEHQYNISMRRESGMKAMLDDARMEYHFMERDKDEEIFKVKEKFAKLQTENEALRCELMVMRNEGESIDKDVDEDVRKEKEKKEEK